MEKAQSYSPLSELRYSQALIEYISHRHKIYKIFPQETSRSHVIVSRRYNPQYYHRVSYSRGLGSAYHFHRRHHWLHHRMENSLIPYFQEET